MKVTFNGTGAVVDGVQLPPGPSPDMMEGLFGTTELQESIRMHPSGTREIYVAEAGAVWARDLPEDIAVFLYFPLRPEDTPRNPPKPFEGTIEINGTTLNADISESKFPRAGEISLQNAHHRAHHSCFYKAGNQTVEFKFERPRNKIGKRSGVHRLACILVSFNGRYENKNSEPQR